MAPGSVSNFALARTYARDVVGPARPCGFMSGDFRMFRGDPRC
jgi:hypothetical protein